MTRLTKPISRATTKAYKVLYSDKLPIVVTLTPGGGEDDLIHVRHLGRRQHFTLTIQDVFWYAVRAHSMAAARAKKLAKAERRKGRKNDY